MHVSPFCGSAMPFSFAIFFAASPASVSKALACFSSFHLPNWSPLSEEA
jgi:hypothetical protein